MKVLLFCTLIAVSQATVLLGTGASTQYRSQDNLGNYAFGYNEGHATGATFRKEAGSNGVVSGSYGLADADGRQRVVNYVADAAGFRADIKTNEPGVEPKDPANTSINKATILAPGVVYSAAAAPVLSYHAAPALSYHSGPVGVNVVSGHPLGGYSYSNVVGHHGFVGHHGIVGHHGLVGHYFG